MLSLLLAGCAGYAFLLLLASFAGHPPVTGLGPHIILTLFFAVVSCSVLALGSCLLALRKG
jgi:hypothetical protein